MLYVNTYIRNPRNDASESMYKKIDQRLKNKLRVTEEKKKWGKIN